MDIELSADREFQGLLELHQILQEVYSLAPPEPTTRSPGGQAPEVAEVLAGLGYIVALQNAPDVSRAVPEGLSRSMLDGLQTVIREWLLRQPTPQDRKDELVAGFFQRTGEHIQRLRTLPESVASEVDGKGETTRGTRTHFEPS